MSADHAHMQMALGDDSGSHEEVPCSSGNNGCEDCASPVLVKTPTKSQIAALEFPLNLKYFGAVTTTVTEQWARPDLGFWPVGASPPIKLSPVSLKIRLLI